MKTEQTESTVTTTEVPKKSTKEPVIEIKNLYKSFGTLEVLKNLTLNLYNGENLVVLGKSGTGKSVLIKCIVGLLRSDSGTINVYNENILSLSRKELDEVRQKIGFLFQSGALYDSMTVKENLEFPLKRLKKHLSQREIDDKLLVIVDLIVASFVILHWL